MGIFELIYERNPRVFSKSGSKVYWWVVTFGFRRNPDIAGNGRLEGRKRVRPIAIDYRTVAGTAGAGYKGDRRSKGPDSRSPERTPTALWRHKGGQT